MAIRPTRRHCERSVTILSIGGIITQTAFAHNDGRVEGIATPTARNDSNTERHSEGKARGYLFMSKV